MPYFVVEEGRGTGLVAYVYGPYASQAALVSAVHPFAGTFQVVGNQGGYATKEQAAAEANRLNTGSATTPTQYQPTGPPANENHSPGAVSSRVQAAGGTVGGLPHITNPLDFLKNIAQFFSALTQPNTWLRVGKVLVGGAMLVAGVIKLTGTDQKALAALSAVPGVGGVAAKGIRSLPGV